MTGIILKYRCPRRPGEPRTEAAHGPLIDAQRAVSLVRSRAKEWKIDPRRIGMVGYSAGGHVVLQTATRFEKRTYEPIDAVDEVSCRPDFAILCYAGFYGKRFNDDPEMAGVIPANSPPFLLAHSSDDSISKAEGSANYYLKLKRANVPAELHIYASGEHDFGVRQDEKLLPRTWPHLCINWLRSFELYTPRP
jgi:acetyl esterase/lipase